MEFPAWDPVLIDIPGLPIDIRWYGLMYVVGFIAAQWLLVRFARRGFFPVPSQQAPDLILYAVLGVMLGGRLGYALFYDPDFQLIQPQNFIQVWKGGLSFHGGLAGVVVAMVLFARKHKIPWLRVGDACALAVTPGIFCVRMANFINGELYGRVTEAGVGWAMRFPTDPLAMEQLRLSNAWTMRDRELCIQVAYKHKTFEQVKDLLTPADQIGRGFRWESVQPHLDWDVAKAHVPFRHPSQLYEGIGEGLVLGLVLFAIWLLTRNRPLRHGWYGALFLLGYAAVRFSLEFVREPDEQMKARFPNGVLLGMTMGQTLSAAMVVGGALILLLSKLRTMPVPEAPRAPANGGAPAGGGA